jgi:hypothetical protein
MFAAVMIAMIAGVATVGCAAVTAVTDVDPADFATVNGDYEFLTTPELSCFIFAPSRQGLPLVLCRPIVFPPNTPAIEDRKRMSPNEIGISDDGIIHVAQLRADPVLAQQLTAGSRIVVGEVQCTSLPEGVDCSTDLAGFHYQNKQLVTRGPLAK